MSDLKDKLAQTSQSNKLSTNTLASGKLGSANAPSFGLKSKLNQAASTNTILDNVANAKERIIIVADDSGSMDGIPMAQQKKAIIEFLGVCNPLDTAVGVTPMNREKITFTMIHPTIMTKVTGWPLHGGGGTPIFSTLAKALEQNPSRVVLVSDGEPTDGSAVHNTRSYYDEPIDSNANWHPVIDKYKNAKIKIDTVYIGSFSSERSISEMKAIAELTGGMYIFFKEGESFAKQFKYLAPCYYKELSAGTIKL